MDTRHSILYQLATGTLALSIFYILYGHLMFIFHSYRSKCQSPPTFPVLQSLQLFLGIRNRLQRHTVMNGQALLHKTYSDTFQRLGIFTNTIHTIDPMNIRTVWSTSFREWGVEAMRMQTLGPFCGRGIATVDGDLWEMSRDLVRPHFFGVSAAKIDLGIVEKYIQKYIDSIPRDGQMIDLQPLIYDIYFETGYEFVIGEPFEKLPGYENVSVRTVRSWLDYGVVGSRKRFVQGPLKYLKKDKRWLESRSSMQKFTEAVIARARQIRVEKGHSKTQGNQTLVNRMIDGFEDNPTQLRDLLMQYFMGSSFTVSGTVTNACYLLSKHPEEWSLLKEEVFAYQEAGFTIETLKTMPYVKKILDESLRLFPLTTVEFRRALKNNTIPTGGGKDGLTPIYTPRGTTLIASIWALHRQESVFGEDVNEFRPRRWDTCQPKRWEYIPFGGGPRVCVGQEKARLESMYILARLAQKIRKLRSHEGALDNRQGQELLGCKVGIEWEAVGNKLESAR